MATKNTQLKTRPESNPYEVWIGKEGEAGRMTQGFLAKGWRWLVLKKYQVDDNKPYARWFCKVYSPYCPDGELGDVYTQDIKPYAERAVVNPLADARENAGYDGDDDDAEGGE